MFFIICRFTNGLSLYITPIVLDHFFDKLLKCTFQLRVACGVVVSMFDFHRSDRGSNPGRGGEFS